MDDITNLTEENTKLRQMNATKSDLISISSHQLRTSLSALKWILKMFLDKDLGAITPEQESFLEKAYTSNERMIALVNDLLVLNKSEDITIPYSMKRFPIVDLIEQTIFEFSGESHKKQIELTLLKQDGIYPHVYADESMLRVVFQNLIENALKYSNPHDKVFISLSAEDMKIYTSVRDTGIGIPKNAQAQIFTKFFRAENAISKESIGSGLGLFTTKQIVERHGGTLSFTTEEGVGTTFSVSLPEVA
jgi:signal transduction histidine kinase